MATQFVSTFGRIELRSSTKMVNPVRKELEKGVLLPGGIKWQSQVGHPLLVPKLGPEKR